MRAAHVHEHGGAWHPSRMLAYQFMPRERCEMCASIGCVVIAHEPALADTERVINLCDECLLVLYKAAAR